MADNILRTSFHIGQSSIRSVGYNVVQVVMLDLIRRDVVEETLDAHISRILDPQMATEKLLKKLLTPNSIMAPFPTFVKRKTKTGMENRKKLPNVFVILNALHP